MGSCSLRVTGRVYLALLLACGSQYSGAVVITDGTVGQATALAGPDYHIPESLGSRVGTNLFHSFQTFGLQTRDGVSESVTFTGSDDIAHVISRVTGGQASEIDGLLKSEIGSADFYFLNPAGIMFGPNAQVDVPSSFHVATADELRLADGSLFSAAHPEQSTLGMAPPEAFGYLGQQTTSLVIDGGRLELAPGRRASFVGSDLILSDASLRVEGGSLRLIALGQHSGSVHLDDSLPDRAGGDLTMRDTTLDVSAAGGGSLHVAAGEVALMQSYWLADNMGDTDATGGIRLQAESVALGRESVMTTDVLGSGRAGALHVQVASDMIFREGSSIASNSYADGRAGDVVVAVDGSLALLDGGQIGSNAFAGGDAGAVSVRAGALRIGNRADIDRVTGIASQTLNDPGGNAGTVTVSVEGLLELFNGGTISSSTYTQGDGGDLFIEAQSIHIRGGDGSELTGVASQAVESSGDGGHVNVVARDLLQLTDGAIISSSTFAEGDAGSVTIRAQDLRADRFAQIDSQTHWESTGEAGSVHISVTDLFALSNVSQVSTSTSGTGDAGTIQVSAGNLRIQGILSRIESESWSDTGDAGKVVVSVAGLLELIEGANISSSTFAAGDGGQVTVEAGALRVDGRQSSELGTVIASIAHEDSSGDAGRVHIEVVGRVELLGGAQISSSNYAMGSAGTVTIHAEEVQVSGGEGGPVTGIMSETGLFSNGSVGNVIIEADRIGVSQGTISITQWTLLEPGEKHDMKGGEIRITADAFTLRDHASLEAAAEYNAPASSILVRIKERMVVENSSIKTTAWSQDGGPIALEGEGGLSLKNSLITTSTEGGDGGNIRIDMGALAMDGGFIQANTAAGAQGGDIQIDVPYLLTPNATSPEVGGLDRQEFVAGSGRNVIQAAAPSGNPGELTLSSPELDISGSLVGLFGRPLENAGLADDPCVAAWERDASSLLTLGRGGVRSHYGNGGFSLAGRQLDAETRSLVLGHNEQSSPERGEVLPAAEPGPKKKGCVNRSSL